MSISDPKNPATRKAPDGFTLGPPATSGAYITMGINLSGEWGSSPFLAQWTVMDGLSWYRHDSMNLKDTRSASRPREDGCTSAALPPNDTGVAHLRTEEMVGLQRKSVLDAMTIEQIEVYLERRRADPDHNPST